MKMKKESTFPAALLFVLVLAAAAPAAPGFGTVDTAGLHSMVVDNAYRIEAGRQKQFAVVDARTKEEYDEAHIFSAISVPEGDFERFVSLLPKDRSTQVVVYCDDRTGTDRKWADRAAALGYTNIVIYGEGFSAWKEQHMPTAPIAGNH